jgi:TolB-like protein/AraC-like DNA-binding protein/Tfp pilus assembly protein PilF
LSLKTRDMTLGIANEKELVERLTQITLENLENENFGGTELAVHAGMSISTLNRRLHKITSKPTCQFIREIRLKKAMELLMQETDTSAEIAYKVGFGSPAYFSKCFHDFYGFPPGEALKRMEEGTLPVSDKTNTSDKTSASENATEEENEVSLKSGKLNKSYLVFVSVALSALIIGFAIIYLSKKGEFIYQPAEQERSIAVLPFKNLSSEEDNQYFADGIMEDILNHLFRIGELRVISRTTSERFRDSYLSTTEIAKSMGVNYLLEGSVRKQGDNIRIAVQLIDGNTDRHLWSENYDRKMADIFIIQSDIAKNVANELQFILTPAKKEEIERIPTVNTDAYIYYLMGRFFWNKRTDVDLKKSVEYFEKAIAADPDYALAHAGLADAYFIQAWWDYIERPQGYEKSKQLATKALELDNNLAEAFATLGGVLCYYDWDWEESREMFIKAIQLNPNYGTARMWYAGLLHILNEEEEAFKQIDKAIELDPVVYMFRSMRSGMYYQAGRYDEALEESRTLHEMHPMYLLRYSDFRIYCKQKEYDKAVEILQEIMKSNPSTFRLADEVRDIYHKAGNNGILQLLIKLEEQKSFTNPHTVAMWYILMEEKELALNWLEIAFENRIATIPRINCNADYDIIRSEPRFIALIEKMGLTPYSMRSAK